MSRLSSLKTRTFLGSLAKADEAAAGHQGYGDWRLAGCALSTGALWLANGKAEGPRKMFSCQGGRGLHRHSKTAAVNPPPRIPRLPTHPHERSKSVAPRMPAVSCTNTQVADTTKTIHLDYQDVCPLGRVKGKPATSDKQPWHGELELTGTKQERISRIIEISRVAIHL
jgi:hypothetical protein